MNVLVLGGNRFIGVELTSRLLALGHEVDVIALDPPPPDLRGLVRFAQIDRNDLAQLKTAFAGRHFDAVFDNIAFLPGHVQGLLDVLGERCGRYVLTSSVDIYPMGTALQWREEDAPLEPSSLEDASPAQRYLRGKRGCEKVLRASGLPFAIVRPAMVTGPRDPVLPQPRYWQHSRAPVSRSLHLPSRVLDGGPVLLPQNDRRVFQLAWVQDVARALVLAGTHPRVQGRAFNVAGDELWSHERLVHALAEAAGRQVSVVRASSAALQAVGLGAYEPPYGNVSHCSLACTDALKELGWVPTPPQRWLGQLLEAARDPDRRPRQSNRVREIAFARRILGSRAPAGMASLPERRNPPPTRQSAVAPSSPAPHGKLFEGQWISSVGIGTHRGDADAATDASYADALRLALDGGINLIDTAINYRAMRSERVVGRVVSEAMARGMSRDDIFLVSKGGFVPHDGLDPRSARTWIEQELVQPGLLDPCDAGRRHSIRPGWVAASLRKSLSNLGLHRLNGYLLHNPELAVPHLGTAFWGELTRSFAVLEEAVADGMTGCYGVALWKAVRAGPADPHQLSIERVMQCARAAAGGAAHHLRLIEMPLNVANVEPLRLRNQMLKGRPVAALEVALDHGLFVLTSASIARGNTLGATGRARLPVMPGPASDHVRALHFTRSVPGVGCALVGMRSPGHVADALLAARTPPLPASEISRLLLAK